MQSQPIIGILIERARLFSLATPLSSAVAEEKEKKSEKSLSFCLLLSVIIT